MTPQTRTALFILAFAFAATTLVRGTQDTYAVFLLPISEEFGWPRAAVSSVYSLTFAVVGLSGPMVGWLFDRWGPFRTYLTGASLGIVACLLASQVQALWQFYLVLGLLFGFASACVGFVTMAAMLSRWFNRRLNTALAIGHSSHGAGMLLLAPTAQLLIDGMGWRVAYAGMAGIVALILPMMLLVPWRRVKAGLPDRQPTGPTEAAVVTSSLTLRQAFATPAFWGIAASFFFTSTGMFAVSLQVPAYLTSIGYSPQAAAQAFGLLGLLLPAGMIGFGWLGDRIGRRQSVLISYAGTITGIASLALMRDGPNLALLGGFVLCFGGTFGSRGPAISTIAATLFRGPHFGRIYGFITVGMGLGGAHGAWLGGFLLDFTGAYLTGQIVAIIAIILGAAPFVVVRAIARS